MAPLLLLAANHDMCVCRCVFTGGVPELHQGAAGEWEQAVYLRNQRLHPHLHQPNGTNSSRLSILNADYFQPQFRIMFLFELTCKYSCLVKVKSAGPSPGDRHTLMPQPLPVLKEYMTCSSSYNWLGASPLLAAV